MAIESLPEKKECLRLRPRPVEWAGVAVVSLLGVGATVFVATVGKPPHTLADWASAACFVLLSFSPALLFAVMMLKIEVMADDTGLRWRNWFKWKQCRWDEVTDYYEQLIPRSGRKTVVVTAVGKLIISYELLDPRPLREIVQRKATSAKVGEWMVLGSRPIDPWPREFDYLTKDNRSQIFAMWFMAILLTFCFAYIVVPKAVKLLSGYATVWDWAGLCVLTILLICMALLISAIVRPTIRDVGRRRTQKITADLAGITYEDAGAKIETRWDDVTDYYISAYGMSVDSRHYVVATRAGEFDFTFRIKDFGLLRAIIARYGKRVEEPGWRSVGPDPDEIISRPRSSANDQKGTTGQYFSYRTRINRGHLWFPTALAVVIPVHTALTYEFGITPYPPTWQVIVIWSATVLLSAWGWWRYFAAGIRLDDIGITEYTPFGTRTLKWEDVTDYKMSGTTELGFCHVIAGHRRIRFWGGIARLKELKSIIAQKAARCGGKSWGED